MLSLTFKSCYNFNILSAHVAASGRRVLILFQTRTLRCHEWAQQFVYTVLCLLQLWGNISIWPCGELHQGTRPIHKYKPKKSFLVDQGILLLCLMATNVLHTLTMFFQKAESS